MGTNPQDLTSLAGKILRINPMIGAPAAGNPGISSPNPNTRLIWNYGHRNPQGLALQLEGTSLLRFILTNRGQLISQELIPEFTGTYGRIRTAQMGTDGSLYLTTSDGGGADVILKVTPTG